MTVSIEHSNSLYLKNKDLDQVFEKSLRLQNKIEQSDTTTQRTIERADDVINSEITQNTLSSKHSNIYMLSASSSSKRIRKSFKKACKCQNGKKCKCGDDCQCSHEIETQLQDQFNDVKDDDRTKRSSWYRPWGHGKDKDKSTEMITKTQSLNDGKRTMLTDELLPNSSKDKEMMEIFSDNEAHSIQDKLVFPHSPIVDSNTDEHDNKNSIIIQNDKNTSNVMLSEQQRKESLVSSDDYSMIKLENSKKYHELKNKELKCTCSNRNSKDFCEDEGAKEEEEEVSKKSQGDDLKCTCSKGKEKKRFFDRFWDKFRLRYSRTDSLSNADKNREQEITNFDEMDPLQVGSSKNMTNENIVVTPDEKETNGSIKGQYNNDNNFHDSYYDELNMQSRAFTL